MFFTRRKLRYDESIHQSRCEYTGGELIHQHTMENQNPNHQSAEDIITSTVACVQHGAEEKIHRVESYTRQSPLPALAIAAAVGYVLRGLPLLALSGLFLRLAMMLVRPFFFIFGAVNLYHFLSRRPAPDSVEEYTPGETGVQ